LSFLKNYRVLVVSVVALSLVVNVLGLILPKINARAIDSLIEQTYNRDDFLLLYGGMATAILLLSLVQVVVASVTAEKIAAELRKQVIAKISRQSFTYVNEVSTAKLLTNLTVDVDSVKNFINQGLVLAFAAVVQLIGSGILLLTINWRLAIPILLTIPVLAIAFGVIFSAIGKYFVEAQKVIDRLNRVINESIVGSALIRVLNATKFEKIKFASVNSEARNFGIKIISGFAALFPIINVVVSASFLIVLGYGGVQVIDGTLTTGDFAAFFSYIFVFISPIILIGFLSNEIQRAFVTYGRIREVIDSEEPEQMGSVSKSIKGEIELRDVSLNIGDKQILKNVSFTVKPKSRVAIIGPTAAGKTQLFYLITGLVKPSTGEIAVDGTPISEFETNNIYSQIGMVFQDSMIFNTSIRDNIAFRSDLPEELIWKAIETAELKDFVNSLPDKLETIITERGSSLSGGQKQRLTLARALALNPKVLLLDDFTARVDLNTEKKILANLRKNYPEITIIAITQKIASVVDFDDVVLLMEGELLAKGTHEQLLKKSIEYKLIFNSQKQVANG
jgi:ATP-binding cassette subfamily B protein